jgi:hypothetical protein
MRCPDRGLALVPIPWPRYELQPLVLEVPLHQFDHRPLEQQSARLGVAAQPPLDVRARG